MGDSSFPARLTVTKDMLNNTITSLFQQYMTIQNNSSEIMDQNTKLQAEVLQLNAKLAGLQSVEGTFNREFLDRSAGRGKQTFFQKHGITTLQDWILLLFFISYGVICICMFAYTVYASKTKIFGGLMVLVISFIIGVLMSAVVMYFA
jgi:regulator of replication initiation timing